jgi:mannosyl-glycoprotein endo-beta-N-acetylglucosaminidase
MPPAVLGAGAPRRSTIHLVRWIAVLVLLVSAVAAAAAADRKATVPLANLKELSAWTPDAAPWNAARQALRPRAAASHPLADLWVPRSSRQRARGGVIAMHDMREGYLPDQDRFPAGTDNKALYRFTYWQYIDTFIYFSHARVAYPPPGWTDSAHRNGVRSLATFNIEGENPDSRKEIRALLDDASRRRAYARQLARIARAYGFDGYLVNIETQLPGDAERKRRRAKSLQRFVAELRREMRKVTPAATVIWYDSIVRSGKLRYQNELNEENAPFFAAADGITVNYDWSPPVDAGSPEHSAEVAGARARDVYSSVDAFCRQSRRKYCGFHSFLGARAAFRAGTSFGVFGPGWTYEGDGAKPDRSTFIRRDRRFWIGTEGEAVPRRGIAEFVAARPIPHGLPFSTHFDQGFGDAVYREGAVAKRGAWGNVRHIDVLPTWRDVALTGAPEFRAELTTDAAYAGGSSFRIAADGRATGYTLRPLFRTAFDGVETVTATVREDGLQAAIVIVAADPAKPGAPLALVLLPPGKDRVPADVRLGLSGKTKIVRLAPKTTKHAAGWSRRSYPVGAALGQRTIAAIGVLAYPGAGAGAAASVLLGELDLR